MEGKKRSEQHLIDSQGEGILRECLPRHWVLREYRPDYGLDFSIEVFADGKKCRDSTTYETLGEHLFVQLKSIAQASPSPLQLYGRSNVEKGPERLDTSNPVGALDTIRQAIDVHELVTVHRMGTCVPVLLVIADLATRRCYFVCLNDYIDKILVPRHASWASKSTRTIHVPLANEIMDSDRGFVALRWYAKRAKLYAAFQRFAFQAGELEHLEDISELIPMAKFFADRISNYDFWENTEMWALIAHYGDAVRRFLATGTPGILQRIRGVTSADLPEDELQSYLLEADIRTLWRSLALLPRNYEDVCREWFLPTGLGYLCCYDGMSHKGSPAQNIGKPKLPDPPPQ